MNGGPLGVELAAALAHAELVARATASLTARPGQRLPPEELRRAAVAVLLVDRVDELER